MSEEKATKAPKVKKEKVAKVVDPNAPVKEKAERINKDLVITVVPENPKRAASGSFARFALYVNGETVAQFVAKGGRIADVHYDSAKGYITLV